MAKQGAATGRTLSHGLSVLLVAPDSGIPKANEEAQRIINLLHPQVLIGSVGVSDVLNAVQAAQYDVVWFLGHSGAAGLQLTDGVLSPAHLTQILRQSPPSLVVLNSCSSIHTAMQVHDDLQAAVICTVLDVPDLDAYITGAALAGALAQGLDASEAYQRSRPASNRQYVMLNGSVRLNGADQLDDVHRLIMATASDLQREMSGMLREVVQTARTVEAIKADVADMKAEQERVRGELMQAPARYQPLHDRRHTWAWALGFVVFVATGLLMLKDVRDALGLMWWVAFAFSAIFYGMAFALFAYGIGLRWSK